MALIRIATPSALALAAAMVLFAAPQSARAGFLDQLFGGGEMAPQAPAPQPGYGYEAPPQDDFGYRPMRTERHVRKAAAVDKTPALQKTTDLMSDKTLRPGDAVMMKSGVHVYDGGISSHHDSDEFVALDDARHVPKQTKSALASMNMTRRAPLSFVASAGDVVEGRSSGGPVISAGYRITDAHGCSIRYVGP